MFSSVKNLFASSSEESLSKRTAKSSFWLLVFRIFSQGFGFARTILLARLLAPSDFGLFGITLMAASFLDTFSQTGFQSALIHKKGDIRPYLDTAFIVQAGKGVLVALILFIFAPFVAMFFNAPLARPMLRVIGFAIFVQGLTNVATIYLQKELEFKKYFFYQISGTIADILVSVVFALMFQNVWALVFGYLAGISVRCIVSYFIHFHMPRLRLDLVKAKELFGYGKWVFSTNVIGFFMSQIDSFFVTKMSGVVSLGFYQVAYKIPSILGLEVLAGATFPAYAKIQDDVPKLKEVYLKITKIFAIIIMPMTVGIFMIIPDFIVLFLGQKWLPSLWPMRILSLSALVWTIAVISDNMFMAIGKPHIHTRWSLIRLLVMAFFLYPCIMMYGIVGAALVVLAGSLVSAIGQTFEALIIIRCKLIQFIQVIIFPFLNALIMAIAVYVAGIIFGQSIPGFLAVIVVGAVAYVLLTWLSDKIFNNKAIWLLKESFRLLG